MRLEALILKAKKKMQGRKWCVEEEDTQILSSPKKKRLGVRKKLHLP